MVSMETEQSFISAQLHGSFLDRQIRRTNRNLFLVSLLLIVGVAGYGFAQRRYFYNFVAGPFAVDGTRLTGDLRPDDQLRYFVKLRGEESAESGLQEVERETEGGSVHNETVTAKYSILVIDKRLLVVKSSPSENGTAFQGTLVELPGDVRAEILRPFLKDYPNASEAFLPVMLDATGFRNEGYIALAVSIPTLLLAAWLIRKLIVRRNQPETHPVVRRASQYGSLPDVSQRLDTELHGNVITFAKAQVTQSWVLLPTAFGLAMCEIPNLIWAYKKVTKHYHNFIPTGKTYEVIVYDRCGMPLQMQAGQKKVDAMLNLLAERAPWAIFGYSDELKQALRSDWGGLVAAVDARRSPVQSGG
jgi:hypothetical protein